MSEEPPTFSSMLHQSCPVVLWPLPQDVIPEDKQPELIDTITKGNVSMRVLKEMFESVLELGPMSQVRSVITRQELGPKNQFEGRHILN